MALEPDQTRWVGIRPTDPPETIPVSMAAAPPCAKVEPCAANTGFNTITKKLAPAVSDLQAIKGIIRENVRETAKDCSVTYTVSGATVPAGEIWVMTNISVRNLTSLCDIQISLRRGVVYYETKAFYSVAPNILVAWCGQLVLEETERMRFDFYLGGLTDDVEAHVRGYKIGVY